MLYAQTALDYAVKQTARQLLTGQKSIASGATQASFSPACSASIWPASCRAATSWSPCCRLRFQSAPLTPTKLAQNRTPTVNPGTSGSLVLMQAYYTPGILNWPLNIPFLVGTAAYRNEF